VAAGLRLGKPAFAEVAQMERALRAMFCSGDASYGDFASCACGACALQFSLCVFF
jgi:hypothetical protein